MYVTENRYALSEKGMLRSQPSGDDLWRKERTGDCGLQCQVVDGHLRSPIVVHNNSFIHRLLEQEGLRASFFLILNLRSIPYVADPKLTGLCTS